MATDATGTPTSLGIPKFNTSGDAPSGLGSNAQMDSIDALLLARVAKPTGIVSGEVPVWNGSAFVRSSVTPIGVGSIAPGSNGQVLQTTGGVTAWGAATGGLTLIADLTLGGSQASFDTNTILGGNIPATYKHLLIVAALRGDAVAGNVSAQIRLNNDSGANYDWQILRGSAATASAVEGFAATSALMGQPAAASAPASVFDVLRVDIPSYNSASINKSMSALSTTKSGTTTGTLQSETAAGFWRSSAAVTRITLLPSSGNWVAGSEFSLYGMS